ncbi:G-type lectin S-receptor-like serine/threonine-protein kinase SD2-5 [Gossypium raimondii]|nr:G-type lectin S-receptor-like serine/threonine-protein kinase SD2-5 [Gossypium raimondii]
MLGMPTRFSYEELKNITKNFSNKLGEGGFGSVFHGILPLGSDVAVKHQFNIGAVNKSFIAEVQTIGSIHHYNLVSLVGFCAESSNRLLVYEYMANGSLDRWIFNQNRDLDLGWQIRRKIILDIAKGLAYLHEECNQKIIHLDIKPQNILLDENFNAKISDFGLSKLIGKDQSRVITAMRGTPGYMAPEWLSSCITEKVDVYSFGIVVLEILCGRRNVDVSQQEEDMHLLGLFKRKQEEGQLMDLVDKCSDDMQSNAAEVVELMKVAAWCLQTEYARRPSMSTVVKLFEGSVDVTGSLNEDFLNGLTLEPVDTFPSIVLPSMLSGPR